MKRIAYMGCLAAAVVAVLVTAASAQRPRSARDEPLRPEARRPEPPRRDGPAPEAIVLRFEHIPAESFLETFHQLAENEHLREGLKQIPIALNEPANAVVLIAPPDVAQVMQRIAEELDHPNKFEMHMHERERGKLGFRLEVEKHKRALDLETMERRLKLEAMKRHLSGAPHPSPGSHPGGPPHGPAHAKPQERARHRGPPPQRGPHGEGGPPGGEPERLFRQKMEELEGHQQRLGRELQEHVQRVHRQLEEIEQHKHRLHEAFQRHMHQRRGEDERRMHEEHERRMQRDHEQRRDGGREEMERREHEERERMALREREEHQRRMPREREEMERREREHPAREEMERREREEMERREHQERERMAQREREEMERREREQRQQREGPRGRPHPGEGRGPGPRAPVQGRPGAGLETLLSPRAREALGLSADQIDRIRRLLAEVRKGLDQTMDRIREAAKKIRPQERAERLRQMMERLKAARGERMRGIHERLMQILRPEQREKIEQMRRGDRPPEPPHPPERPHPPEPREPPEPHPRPPEPHGRPHRPAIQEEPAEFRLIQDVMIAGNTAVKIEVQATPGGVRVLGGSAGSGRGRWTQMSEAERQAMREKSRARYLFRMLCDADIRAELDLAADQEKKIVALIERCEKERTRIEDDVRMQFGSSDAAGPDPGDPAGRERDMRRETGQAMRDAQPAFDTIMQETVDTLTEEQKAKLDEVIRERMRLMYACGNLWTLTTASAKERLELTDGQSAKIKKTLLEAADRSDEQRKALGEKRKAILAANPDAASEERRQAYRAVYEGLRKSREESIKRTRERVFKLLTAEQEPKAETLLAEADSNRRGTFGGVGTYNTIRIGGQSRAPDPPPAMTPQIVPAVYEGGARFHLAGQDLDEPGSKARKDGFKSPKTKPSKSEGAFADRKRAVMILRLLQDPAIRAEVGLSGEQEKRIFVLREKVQSIEDRIRDDVRQILGDRMKNAATAAERGDIKRQAAEIAKEAQRAAAGDMEAIIKEAAEVLTPDQQAKLKVIERDRARMYRAVGRLAMLLEARIREKIGIADEQAERIRLILEDARKQVKDQKGWPSGDLADVKRRHADRVRAARERVMRILSADQRELLERLLGGGSSKKGRKRDALETAPATKGYGQAA